MVHTLKNMIRLGNYTRSLIWKLRLNTNSYINHMSKYLMYKRIIFVNLINSSGLTLCVYDGTHMKIKPEIETSRLRSIFSIFKSIYYGKLLSFHSKYKHIGWYNIILMWPLYVIFTFINFKVIQTDYCH